MADESQLPELPVVCQYPHEEFLTVTEFSLPELIFPENVISYCYNCPSLVHIYTDGSCQNPSNITSRFATYCVVIDWCQTDNERIHEARCYQETGKIPDTLQIVGYARCRGEQSIARAELFAITRCFEELSNIMVHSDSQFAIYSHDLAKHATTPCDWKDHSQFDLVERIFNAGFNGKHVKKNKAHQNPLEVNDPLSRYHVLGNMLADAGAQHAIDNLEVVIAKEQQQRHEFLEKERNQVSALYQLFLDLQHARAQMEYNDTAESTQQETTETEPPELTLQDLMGNWNPESEWQMDVLDVQWLIHSAWGHGLATTIIQWFQQCRWPCNSNGPGGKATGISWTEICLSMAIQYGGWLPVRRGTGKDEMIVRFESHAEAEASDTNLAEQTINIWKIIQHIQSLTPQRLWPQDVGQGKVSAMFHLGNPIFTTGFLWRPCFPHQKVVCELLMNWLKAKGSIQAKGLPVLSGDYKPLLTEVDQNLTAIWKVRYLKSQSVMKMVQRARKAQMA